MLLVLWDLVVVKQLLLLWGDSNLINSYYLDQKL